LFVAIAGAATGKLPDHSVSPSAQFLIYAEDNAARGAVSVLAEKTKANLLSVLHVSDSWKTPIIINLQPTQANVPELPPAALRLSQTGFGLKIQIDLTIGATWDRAALERQLLRGLLLEMIYRAEPNLAAGTNYVEPPDWLIDGLIAAAPGRDRGAYVEALTAAGKVTPLEQFLRQRPDQLDSPAHQLYGAYAFVLTQTLLERENGHALSRYIQDLSHGSNDPLADLQRQFPELKSTDWKAEVTQIKLEYGHQLLTFAETDRKLDDLISKVSLHDLATRKISDSERTALIQLKLELLLLAARANPILRPTVQDYELITVALLTGKKRGIPRCLSGIEQLHQQIATRMGEIDDYMNWFEAAKLGTLSGLFMNYASAEKEQAESRPHRRDPVSIYLDALEEQF
jgi:hypothetical protein